MKRCSNRGGSGYRGDWTRVAGTTRPASGVLGEHRAGTVDENTFRRRHIDRAMCNEGDAPNSWPIDDAKRSQSPPRYLAKRYVTVQCSTERLSLPDSL
jgi:hypothetical protein